MYLVLTPRESNSNSVYAQRYATTSFCYHRPPGSAICAHGDPSAKDVEIVRHRAQDDVDPDRGSVRTTHEQLREQQPQSTPAALKFSPGVYVQQTAHGQGSPYIRGRTGQQTLFLFDGLRLNHALFRKGPNQYLFTVDARTLASIDVVRGSASVELGNASPGPSS